MPDYDKRDAPFRNLHTHRCGKDGGQCLARIAATGGGKSVARPNRNRSEAMLRAWARRREAANALA
jgi:hypothetical protein